MEKVTYFFKAVFSVFKVAFFMIVCIPVIILCICADDNSDDYDLDTPEW